MRVGEWMLVGGMTLAVSLGASTLRAASIIDNWASVKAPPAPELKQVKVDPKTTALLVLDMVNQFCPRYPHCPEMIPTVKKLLTEARSNRGGNLYEHSPIRRDRCRQGACTHQK